jgi:hypothetical protein
VHQVEILEQAVLSMRFMVNEAVASQLAAAEQAFTDGEKATNMITPRGLGRSVPIFLRYEGPPLPRLPISKQQTELLCKEIWSLKTMSDEEGRVLGKPETTLGEFFQGYVEERGGSTQHQMEFSHNFVRALEEYADDADVELFLNILFDVISEQHYYDQMTMIAHLKKALMQMDVLDQVRDGLIHKGVFFNGLRLFFPIKSETYHRTLEDIVMLQMMSICPDTKVMMVDTHKIFMENEDGDQSDFMEAVRDQYYQEITRFPDEIRHALFVKVFERESSLAHDPGVGQFCAHHLMKEAENRRTHAAFVARKAAAIISEKQDSGKSHLSANSGESPEREIGVFFLPAGNLAAALQELDRNKTQADIKGLMHHGMSGDRNKRASFFQDKVPTQRSLEMAASSTMEEQERTAREHVHDPHVLVDVEKFLDRLNTLFLHRAGHYRADQDIASLARYVPPARKLTSNSRRMSTNLNRRSRRMSTRIS